MEEKQVQEALKERELLINALRANNELLNFRVENLQNENEKLHLEIEKLKNNNENNKNNKGEK